MMEAAERELFESAIRRAVETSGGAELDAALDELGWRDALEADRGTAISLLFEAQGAASVTSAALDWVLSWSLGEEGRGVAAVVLPPLRTHEAPGRLDRERYAVRGLGSAALARADVAIVAAEAGDGHVGLAVKTADLEVRPVHGLDPALGLSEVTGDVEAARAEPVDWGGALAIGQLALGHELVGTGRAMLELARLHALERMQFGRPIGSFQAVRHRLAESLVALEAAAALLDAAWEDPSPVTAAAAKALAGRAARTTARHAQQVLAGIGFTTEHPLHLFVRRAVVTDQLLGAGTALTRRLGTELLESRSLPSVFPL
jgi:hypothetical protein